MNSVDIQSLSARLQENIGQVIMGKDEVIQKLVISLLCGGHVLLEDIPGTGKTTLAKALARSVSCDFKRIQFTPDLLPSDLTGINFYNQKLGEFVLKKGAVFTNILLADEINRATPRTQSALLECMEERQISIDGVTYVLPPPFLVIATQNPIEIQGTFPLPEAQLDRFFMKLSVGYPRLEAENQMLSAFTGSSPLESLTAAADQAELIEACQYVRTIAIHPDVQNYLLAVVGATRNHDKIRLGVSPRGAIALLHAAQGHAAVQGRGFVTPDDIKGVCMEVLCHRIICKGYHMSQSAGLAEEILRQILTQTPAPVERV